MREREEEGKEEGGRKGKDQDKSRRIDGFRWFRLIGGQTRPDPTDRVYRGPGETRRTQKQTSTFCSRPVGFLQAPTTMSSPAATAADQ